MLTFFRWARAEGYTVDPRIMELKRPKVRVGSFPVRQVRDILAACNPKVPQEDLVVRLPVGSGVRASEACGGPRTPPRCEGGDIDMMNGTGDAGEVRPFRLVSDPAGRPYNHPATEAEAARVLIPRQPALP